MSTKNLNNVLEKENKKPILFDLFLKKDGKKKGVVIFCHGYKGFKDWGAWNLVAESFSRSNFFFLKFNFSHNGGTVRNPIDFPDLDSFGNNNFSLELEDLNRVIDWILTNKEYENEIDHNDITLVGHSRGGGIVLIKASESKKIKRVITWAGVRDFKERFKIGSPEFKLWEQKGVTYIENGRTKQMMPHYFQFFEDFLKNESKFNIESAVGKLRIPYLVVHGEKDTSVEPKNGESLFSWNKNNEIFRVAGGDHTFSSKHPWNSKVLPNELKTVVKKTIDFIIGI